MKKTLGVLVFLIILAFTPAKVLAADTGSLPPSANSGTGMSYPTNAYVSDNQFGLIPYQNTLGNLSVSLSWDGGTSFTTAQTISLPITETINNYGGAANTWGRTWSDTDFSNANFIVRLADDGVHDFSAFSFNVPSGATIDGIEVNVEGYKVSQGAFKTPAKSVAEIIIRPVAAFTPPPPVGYVDNIDQILVTVFYTPAGPASCEPPLSGDYIITADCSFAGVTDGNNEVRLVDGVDFGPGSTNTATLTIQSGILTINANQTIAVGTMVLTGGSVAVADGAIINPGMPLWLVDQDADGYTSEIKVYAQSTNPPNGRRRGLFSSIGVVDCDDATYSEANLCGHRRPIALTYSEEPPLPYSNFDVVFGVDTASSIAAGYMTADCGDIRMKDSDGITELSYWIESGCNTSNTQIWVQVPYIPSGGKTIYMDYDGTTATNGFTAWAGNFTLMYNNSCPAGWTQNADFNSKFPYGSATYGTIGGSDSHTHAQVLATSGQASAGANAIAGTGNNVFRRTHTHANLRVNVNAAANVLPPYLDVVFCEKNDLVIPASFISMFATSDDVPGWTRFSALDSKLPRGAASYGGTGGSVTHSHSTTGGLAVSNGATTKGSTSGDSHIKTHTHNSQSGSTATANNVPPFVSMVFNQANGQTVGTANMVTITDVIPPLGWTRFSSLDNKFPEGGIIFGEEGGAATHLHSVTMTTTGASSTWAAAGCCTLAVSQASHTHSITTNTDSQSNLPPYASAIFAQRKSLSLVMVNVGAEE